MFQIFGFIQLQRQHQWLAQSQNSHSFRFDSRPPQRRMRTARTKLPRPFPSCKQPSFPASARSSASAWVQALCHRNFKANLESARAVLLPRCVNQNINSNIEFVLSTLKHAWVWLFQPLVSTNWIAHDQPVCQSCSWKLAL